MPSVATTLRLNQKQVAIIDRIADRLGMERMACIRYLVQTGISTEQVRNAISEGAEATGALVNVMTSDIMKELDERESVVRDIVTPAQGSKVAPSKGRGRGGREHVRHS